MIPFKIQIKTLWEMRFKKILKLEEESVSFYEELLAKNQNLLEGTKSKEKLETLIQDEKRHAQVAARLLRILSQK